MNTEQMSQLFFLHTSLNEPLTTGDQNEETAFKDEAKSEGKDPLGWLFKIFEGRSLRRNQVARLQPST